MVDGGIACRCATCCAGVRLARKRFIPGDDLGFANEELGVDMGVGKKPGAADRSGKAAAASSA